MEMIIQIPEYTKQQGFIYNWIDNFEISVKQSKNEVMICANKEGLLSLANHLLNLAQENVPYGTHIHLNEYNSLEENSLDLIIEKI